MQHTNSTSRYAFPDKVKINLDVLGALMLHRIRREIHSTDVVTENQCSML
jgi:hypothetical protein